MNRYIYIQSDSRGIMAEEQAFKMHIDREILDIDLSVIASQAVFNPPSELQVVANDETMEIEPVTVVPMQMVNGDSEACKYLAVEFLKRDTTADDFRIAQLIGNTLFAGAQYNGYTKYDPVVCGLPISIFRHTDEKLGVVLQGMISVSK